MLEYRVRRLPAALRAAHAQGRAGARFPWESARTGRGRHARARLATAAASVVPIRTGALEEHIVADVAWAAALLRRLDRRRRVRGRARAASCSSRPRATGPRGSSSTPTDAATSAASSAPTSTTSPSTTTPTRTSWRAGTCAGRPAPRRHGRRSTTRERRALARAGRRARRRLRPRRPGSTSSSPGFYALEPLVIAEVAPQRPVAADLLLGADAHAGRPGRQAGRRADAALPRAR